MYYPRHRAVFVGTWPKLPSSVTMGRGAGRLPSDMKVGFQTDGVKLRAASDLQALGSDDHLSGSSSRREKQVVSSSHTSVQFSQTSSASALESHSFP